LFFRVRDSSAASQSIGREAIHRHRAVNDLKTSATEARQGHSCDALEVKSSTDDADSGRSFADPEFL
jgi:hypothetical protein